MSRRSVVADPSSCRASRCQTRAAAAQQLLAVNPVQRPRARSWSGLRVAADSIDLIAEMEPLRPKSRAYRLVVPTMQKHGTRQRIMTPVLVLRVGLSYWPVARARRKFIAAVRKKISRFRVGRLVALRQNASSNSVWRRRSSFCESVLITNMWLWQGNETSCSGEEKLLPLPRWSPRRSATKRVAQQTLGDFGPRSASQS